MKVSLPRELPAQLENWQLVTPGGVGADGQSRAVLR